MSERAKQLLLELLLLQAKYSPEELAAVERVLDSAADRELLLPVINLLHKLEAPRPRKGELSRGKLSLGELKEQFVDSLKNRSRSRDVKGLKSIAYQLNIEQLSEDRNKAISQISHQLSRMNNEELEKFLRRTRRINRPDEGFVGLANYILRKDEDENPNGR